MVSAFVHMQAKSLSNDEAREALQDTERRIQAIAQVHRKLYTSGDVESVDMGEYLSAIIEELQAKLYDFVPYVSWGQWNSSIAHRANIKGVVVSPQRAYWNITKE